MALPAIEPAFANDIKGSNLVPQLKPVDKIPLAILTQNQGAKVLEALKLQRKKQFDRAATLYRQVDQSSLSFEIHYNLGLCLEELRRWDESIDAFRRASNLAPKDTRPYKHLANIFKQKGKDDRPGKQVRRNPCQSFARKVLISQKTQHLPPQRINPLCS